MPYLQATAEQRHVAATLARDRLFIARPAPAPECATDSIGAAERRTLAAWASDRAARIRSGACPLCAECRCPCVGGRDAECVAD